MNMILTLQGSTSLLIPTHDVMRKSDAATVNLDEYDSDATRFDTPTNVNTMSYYDVMYKSDAATVIPDDLDDSDAIRLDTPTSIY